MLRPDLGTVQGTYAPSPGNHEFHSSSAAPYFDYFGANAGDPKTGYYSYDLGAWHVIVLNSECVEVGGCQAGSAEEKWLRADLSAHPAACTISYWHKPLFSSGAKHGNDPEIKPFWKDLYQSKATLVVNGHDHDYERFAPQDPDGRADSGRGIREFVVGTGGKSHRPFATPLATSEVRNADTYGVLKLTLHPHGYDWEFLPEAGKSFRDSGTGICQGSSPPVSRRCSARRDSRSGDRVCRIGSQQSKRWSGIGARREGILRTNTVAREVCMGFHGLGRQAIGALVALLVSLPLLMAAGNEYHLVKKYSFGAAEGSTREYFDYVTVDSAARRVYLSHGTEVKVIDADSGELDRQRHWLETRSRRGHRRGVWPRVYQ